MCNSSLNFEEGDWKVLVLTRPGFRKWILVVNTLFYWSVSLSTNEIGSWFPVPFTGCDLNQSWQIVTICYSSDSLTVETSFFFVVCCKRRLQHIFFWCFLLVRVFTYSHFLSLYSRSKISAIQAVYSRPSRICGHLFRAVLHRLVFPFSLVKHLLTVGHNSQMTPNSVMLTPGHATNSGLTRLSRISVATLLLYSRRFFIDTDIPNSLMFPPTSLMVYLL